MPKTARPAAERIILRAIGNRIKWVRELAGDSQSDLARRFNSDQSKWSKYESGQRRPEPMEMIEFCDWSGATMDYVYRGIVLGCDPELALQLVAAHPELLIAGRKAAR